MERIKKTFIFKKKEARKGFTLIELLVAVAILGLVVVTSTSLFFTSLKARKKTESLVAIKQSGDYALSVMTNMIRNATAINSCGANSIEILNPDGETTTFTVVSERLASNSAYLTADNISLSNYSLNCSTQAGSPTTVTISFKLSKGDIGDPLGYATQDFKSTVSLRTY